MKKQFVAISIIAAILLLSACGQTGDLYLSKEINLKSESTLAKSDSSTMKQNQQSSSASVNDNYNDSTTEVDNDPTPPVRNNKSSPSVNYSKEIITSAIITIFRTLKMLDEHQLYS